MIFNDKFTSFLEAGAYQHKILDLIKERKLYIRKAEIRFETDFETKIEWYIVYIRTFDFVKNEELFE